MKTTKREAQMTKAGLKEIVASLIHEIRSERSMFEKKIIIERDKTLEIVKQNKRDAQQESKEIFILYLEKMQESFDRLAEKMGKRLQGVDLAGKSDGPIAAINLLAVESLFLLERRARNKNNKEFTSLQLLLSAVENWSRAKMTEEMKGIIYCGSDPPLPPGVIKIIERLKKADERE